MGESSLPWGTAADDPDSIPAMYQERWRSLFGGALAEGIVNDVAGDGLKVITNGSAVVTVRPGEAVVQGVHYANTADLPLNLDAVGTPPTSSTRFDWIVLRYDAINQEVRAVVVAGTLGGGVPALQADPDGLWDVPLAQLQRSNTTAASSALDARRHVTTVSSQITDGHPSEAAVGALVLNRSGTYYLRALVGGTPTWKGRDDDDGSAWTEFNLNAGLAQDIFLPLSYKRQGKWNLLIQGIVRTDPSGFFTPGAAVAIGAAPYDFGNVANDDSVTGGRLFPVVLTASGADGSMTAPVISTARMRASDDVTVYIPSDVSGCNVIQFSTVLKVY